jgi:serine/threonine protein kinase
MYRPVSIAGRYEIRAKLGEGGMGVVYRAYDPHPVDREVAVKMLHEFADPRLLGLFYRECSALKSISHPNIVEIFDIGEFEEGGHRRPFFVMPLLKGQTLDEMIRTSSHRLTVNRVVEIFAQTCRGLQAAHDRGLVHRDLKPSNIFVLNDDSVKIIDFGIAHVVHSAMRTTGFAKGTLLYLSPEQVQHKPVSFQSDIFSLGVTLYEALTRRQPFRADSEDAVIQAILTLIPPPASELNPAVSQTISRVVHKAMAKQSWNRFDSARELGDTLQKAARDESITLFDPARMQPRIQTAAKALEKGDYQFAGEILSELEAEGNIDPQITLLRTQIDQIARQRTIAQLLDSARARYDEDEDPLALSKLQEVLNLDPTNVVALSLKSKIDDRRSDRQIEKWVQLAQQHISNHAYGHAREAVQNALVLRPRDSRAARLLKTIEVEEQEYMRVRQEKTEVYQAAVNLWKNGEVSHALSRMQHVLDLDRRAPDATSPDAAGTYQSFYDKIREEHEAINSGYAEARRLLGDRKFAAALQICERFLTEYPGNALFQLLKIDVEDQQRQQLSAYIADFDDRLEDEPDLDARLDLVREAVAQHPDDEHFRRLAAVLEDKRNLVNSLVERARVHEAEGQIAEALADLETLRAIHGSYPGLAFEKTRLQKRLDQQTSDAARATWVRQIDGQLEAGNYARVEELLKTAEVAFPDDAELVERRNLAKQARERTQRVAELVAEGQQLCAQGQFEQGVDLLKMALELDDQTAVRHVLRDLFVARAQESLDKDWPAVEAFADRALELDPSHALALSLRAQALAHTQQPGPEGRESASASRDDVEPVGTSGMLDPPSAENLPFGVTRIIPFPPPTGDSHAGADSSVEAFSQTVIFRPGPSKEDPTEPPEVQLVITDSPNPSSIGHTFALSNAAMVIGREGNWLSVADSGWSREHASISVENGGFFLTDLGSSNGTRVNGVSVRAGESRELFFGSRISIGETVLTFSSARATAMPDLTGGEVDGRYILEERIRAGSTAALYAARDVRLPGRLAVKVLSPRLSAYPGYSARFQQQANLARQLLHPHICQVLDYGRGTVTRPNGPALQAHFMCLALMDGGNLADRLEKGVPDRRKAVEWIQLIGGALDYAHRRHIVHGDIKPTAIVFDADENPYLTDFAVLQNSGGKPGYIMGAPAFMAPEHWESGGLTPATDQFSLAALSYFLLTGSRPFEGQDHPEIRRRNFARGPLPAHTEAQHHGQPPLPRGVSHVLEKALNQGATERYADIAEFTRALSTALIRPPRRPEAGQVFLSYHRETSAGWVNYFAVQLRARSLSVYLDTSAGAIGNFSNQLVEAIEDCAVFVCFLDERALASKWIQYEISLAHQYGRPMIPVFLEGHPPASTEVESTAARALLTSQGVHFEDQNAEGTVAKLAAMILKCIQPT